MAEAGLPEQASMTLMEHLQELRGRLMKCALAVLVLGVGSLVFAKPIFGLLMRPVLEALPPESRSLIYTSGVEELNVLMKVGLYSGVFLTTPVILWQVWGFVSPGLYPTERKMAAPFVALGSLAFLSGALFCYFVLLPTMFQFLLRGGDEVLVEQRLSVARLREADALRYVALGELDRAGELAKKGKAELGTYVLPPSPVPMPAPSTKVELEKRVEGVGRLIDAAMLTGANQRAALREVVERHLAAGEALAQGRYAEAAARVDEAVGLFARIAPDKARPLAEVWALQKEIALQGATLKAQAWTTPMLTMREQLSLVLVLELLFGAIFELPIVMALLALAGVVKAKWLMRYQRHAFVLVLIAAAVLTPTGDAVNLALMAGPMFLCFELGIVAAWIIERRRERRLASALPTVT
jgi:sec-independent protein translocase protein TatC